MFMRILDRKPKVFTSVSDHLRNQGRYKHLGEEEIKTIIRHRDEKWKQVLKSWKLKSA